MRAQGGRKAEYKEQRPMIERVEGPRSQAGRCWVREERREGEMQRGVEETRFLSPAKAAAGLFTRIA